MKKILLPLIIIFSIFIVLTSCKKDKPERTVTGYWKGKTTGIASTDWSWLVRNDNTLRVYIGSDSATANKFNGTYVTTDTTITATYAIAAGFVTVVKCTLNSTYTHMEGGDIFGNTYYLDK